MKTAAAPNKPVYDRGSPHELGSNLSPRTSLSKLSTARRCSSCIAAKEISRVTSAVHLVELRPAQCKFHLLHKFCADAAEFGDGVLKQLRLLLRCS